MGNSAGRKGDPSSVDADFARRVGLAFYTEEHSHVDHVNISFEHVTSHRSRRTLSYHLFFLSARIGFKETHIRQIEGCKGQRKVWKVWSEGWGVKGEVWWSEGSVLKKGWKKGEGKAEKVNEIEWNGFFVDFSLIFQMQAEIVE